ncbi:MAG: PAS domain S-box protein [Opitutaceae bacterium]|nr:PAS domain S-box protein [Opitutaceae bacterium]
MVACFAVQYRSYTRAAELRLQNRHAQQLVEQQLELQSRLSDAALAMRGFVLTGDGYFLEVMDAATGNLDSRVLAAGSQIQHPRVKERFARVERLMREQLRSIGEAVDFRRQGDLAAGAPERHLQVRRGQEALRQEFGELLTEEHRLLAAQEAEAIGQDRQMRLIVLGGGIIALGFLGLVAAGLVRENRRRHRAEARLHEANATLETRVAERTSELTEQKQRLHAVVETAVDGILTINERGLVDSMNAAAERMFGYHASEVIGRNVSLLMPSPHREQHDGYIARYCATGQAKIIGIGREVTGQRKDGTVFPLALAISEVKAGDRRIFTGLVRDLTERKRLEAAVTSTAEQERGRIARDLHDGLGHELGGALFLGNLLQRDLQARGAAEADRAAQIYTLIDQALADVREISRGLYPVPPEPDGLMSALQLLADRITRDGRIECRFDTDSAVLLDDPTLATHLYRIAQEAVNNALKHSGTSRIDIHLAATAHILEISVRDHGTGWPQQPPASGGLGLQTMRHRAQLIGGRFTAENAPEGAGVLVTCTVARAARGTSGTAPAADPRERKP